MLIKQLKTELLKDPESNRIFLIKLLLIEELNLTLNSKRKKIKELLPSGDRDFRLKLKKMKEKSQLLREEQDWKLNSQQRGLPEKMPRERQKLKHKSKPEEQKN